MPMDVTMPDGTVITDVPDGTTKAQLQAKYESHIATQSAPSDTGSPSIMDRLRTNTFTGAPLQTVMRAGQGAEQLIAHSAADLSDLGGHAPNSLATMLHAIADHIDAANAEQNKGYEGAKERVVNSSSNPRVTKAMINTGETMGNMLNPAGLAGNLVEAAPGIVNAATRGVVSGAAYGATQPVEGGDYWTQKAKQVGVGAATGALTGAAAEALGPKAAPPPTSKDFKQQATNAYKAAEAEGVTINQDSFQNTVGDIKADVEKAGLDPQLTPKANAVLSRFDKEAEAGPITLEKADTLRKVALAGLDTPEKNDRRLTHMIIDKLDDYIDGLTPADVSATGNVQAATDALTDARSLYAKGAKAGDIDRMIEKAKNAVGANYTAAGYDTALRQQFRRLADNSQAMGRFNPSEQAQILKIVRGTNLQNTLRLIGKLSPTNALALGGEIVGGLSHPDIALPIAAGGYVARQAAAKMGANNVNTLSEMVRGRNALASPGPSPNIPVWNPLPGLAVNALMQPRTQ